MVLPNGYPISAVATEHMALFLCVLMAYEAQTRRCVIEPGWEIGVNETPDGRQREDSRAGVTHCIKPHISSPNGWEQRAGNRAGRKQDSREPRSAHVDFKVDWAGARVVGWEHLGPGAADAAGGGCSGQKRQKH